MKVRAMLRKKGSAGRPAAYYDEIERGIQAVFRIGSRRDGNLPGTQTMVKAVLWNRGEQNLIAKGDRVVDADDRDQCTGSTSS